MFDSGSEDARRVNGAAASGIDEQSPLTDKWGGRFSRATNILSYLVLAGGVATIAVMGYLVWVSRSKLPFWDTWEQIGFAANEGPSHTLEWLWRQYNQHRLVISKLFLLADLRWFHATQTFLLASIFVIQLLLLLLLGWSMRVLGEWRGALWRTGFGVAAFCLFCPSQWSNFVWGFQTCFVLPALFATLSFIGLNALLDPLRAINRRMVILEISSPVDRRRPGSDLLVI
jgi:hypothetical protein